jgi:hypothetical protein
MEVEDGKSRQRHAEGSAHDQFDIYLLKTLEDSKWTQKHKDPLSNYVAQGLGRQKRGIDLRVLVISWGNDDSHA